MCRRNWIHILCGTLTTSLLTLASISGENNETDHWNGKEYHKNSSSQKDAATELMTQIILNGKESILDIGCGSGKITAEIAQQVPQGRMLGVDISPSMIKFARETFQNEHYPNLKFELMAAEEIEFDNDFDIVLSFTALQWARDHKEVLKRVYKGLKPNGRFAVSMPMGMPEKFQEIIDEVIKEEMWSNYFVDFDTGWNFVDKETYTQSLEEEGFIVAFAEDVKQVDVHPSVASFKHFISQWFPYLRPLPEHLKEMFMDQILEGFTMEEPLDKEGKFHFVFHRLDVIADKIE